jgi:hypothetical protein
MHSSVVLVHPPGSQYSEISPCHELAVVEDFMLGFHRNAGGVVEDTHHRLPGRLTPPIKQGNDHSQLARAAPALGGCCDQLLGTAVTDSERVVA